MLALRLDLMVRARSFLVLARRLDLMVRARSFLVLARRLDLMVRARSFLVLARRPDLTVRASTSPVALSAQPDRAAPPAASPMWVAPPLDNVRSSASRSNSQGHHRKRGGGLGRV
jgi:hypothetical protein